MMNLFIIATLLITTLKSLSPTGTNILEIGIHLARSDADLIQAAYLRVAQLNQIPTLIDPNTKLELVYIQSNDTDSETLRAGNTFAKRNVAAVIGAGKSGLTAYLSLSLQELQIPLWFSSIDIVVVLVPVPNYLARSIIPTFSGQSPELGIKALP